MSERPAWWSFDIAFSPHVFERMQDRGFGETDVRAMLDDVMDTRPSSVPGRFVLTSRHGDET